MRKFWSIAFSVLTILVVTGILTITVGQPEEDGYKDQPAHAATTHTQADKDAEAKYINDVGHHFADLTDELMNVQEFQNEAELNQASFMAGQYQMQPFYDAVQRLSVQVELWEKETSLMYVPLGLEDYHNQMDELMNSVVRYQEVASSAMAEDLQQFPEAVDAWKVVMENLNAAVEELEQ